MAEGDALSTRGIRARLLVDLRLQMMASQWLPLAYTLTPVVLETVDWIMRFMTVQLTVVMWISTEHQKERLCHNFSLEN